MTVTVGDQVDSESSKPTPDERRSDQKGSGAPGTGDNFDDSAGRETINNFFQGSNSFLFGGPVNGQTRRLTSLGLSEEARSIREIFVPPDNFESTKVKLASERLIVLHGADGSGKTGLSLALFLELSNEHQLRLISTPESLAELVDRPWERGYSYLIQESGTDLLGRADEFGIRQLLSGLKEAEAFLVITSAVEPDRFSVTFRPFAAVCRKPDVLLVLQRRLVRHATESVADTAARAILHHFGQSASLRRLVEVSDSLCKDPQTLDDPDRRDEKLRGWDRSDATDIKDWFAKKPEPDEIRLLLTLGVMAGAPISSVNRAEDLLLEFFPDDVQEGVPSPGIAGWFDGLDRYAVCEAEVKVLPVDGDSRPWVSCVVFRKSERQEATLKFLWSQPRIRAKYANWIAELANDIDPQLHVRAGAAAGFLGLLEFGAAQSAFLEPWALDDPRSAGIAAAIGVSQLIDAPSTASVTVRMIKRWARSSVSNQRWTAAVASGLRFGETYPDEALAVLISLMCKADPPVVEIIDSLHNIFATSLDHAVVCLTALQDGMVIVKGRTERPASPEENRGRRATLLFYFQALCARRQHGVDSIEGIGVVLNAVLRSGERSDLSSRFFALMSQSFDVVSTRSRADVVIRRLVKAADKQRLPELTVQKLLKNVASSARPAYVEPIRSHINGVVAQEVASLKSDRSLTTRLCI